jgi:hypothetical protein
MMADPFFIRAQVRLEFFCFHPGTLEQNPGTRV